MGMERGGDSRDGSMGSLRSQTDRQADVGSRQSHSRFWTDVGGIVKDTSERTYGSVVERAGARDNAHLPKPIKI